MKNPTSLREQGLLILITVLMLVTLGIDAVTPLGYAEWCLYFVCVGLTILQSRLYAPFVAASGATLLLVIGADLSPEGIASTMSVVNRLIGGASCWIVAVLVWLALRARRHATRMLWLQESQNAIGTALRGEHTPEALAINAIRALCEPLGAHVGALYRLDGDHLVLAGGVALDGEQPRRIHRGAGLLGETLQLARPRRLRDLAEEHLSLTSTLGRSAPAEILMVPVTADGLAIGAMELGRMQRDDALGVEDTLLEQAAEIIGVSLRTAIFRQRQAELLEETQRQSEELQTQQEELRVANEELEEQSRVLQQSQASLEAQQVELEQTNVQLEERTQDLEAQKRSLLRAQEDLKRNASTLETTSRYKSEFLANMSHELRTPLNSSLILSKLLADNKDGTLTGEQVKYAQAIHSSNNDLLALINDILDLSKIEAGHVELVAEPLAVQAVLQRLRETFEPLTRQKGLGLVVQCAADAPAQITGDMQRLLQILKNLLANAVKFTDAGEVSLRVEAGAAGHLRFVVCDTGIGIAADQLHLIFDAFRQADGSTSRRFGGTGLGLSISRELAQRMGGDITVQSEPGRGSCFTLLLPCDAQPSAAGAATPDISAKVPAPKPSAIAPSRADDVRSPDEAERVEDDQATRSRPSRLILAVEDDPAFAKALVALAHETDFDCVVAGTAEEALRLAAQLEPSGILLDINLPDISGLSVLERLKRDPVTRHIPVHMVSALERSQVALELGAVGYVLKPATREVLVDAIRQLEDRHQRSVRRLLIVEDDADLRENLKLLLAREQLDIVAVGTVAGALEKLSTTTFDCMVTDLALPDGSGYDLLEQMAASEALAFPPVIVYTGRALTRDEEHRLRRHSKTIIIKGARSPERLLDEVTLFLHSVEASLPVDQQRLLRQARKRDAMLDGRNLLLAEDDVRNIFALSSVLEPLGVNLEIARNGREAIERLEEREIDLVLMDIMMPEMDGLTAMRHIRQQPRWAGLPIIALTAKAMADDRELCLEAGANDYIAKPIDIDKLVSLCRVWCPK